MEGIMIVPTERGFETYPTRATVGKDQPIAIHPTLPEALAALRNHLTPLDKTLNNQVEEQ